MNSITVILPICNQENDILSCLRALESYVEKCHTILIINDLGACNTEALEQSILSNIANLSNCQYHKTEGSIGLINICNYAIDKLANRADDILIISPDTVIEQNSLASMHTVLHLTEKHGVVCPRSNIGAFTAISKELTNDQYNYELWQQSTTMLAEYTVVPWSNSFCTLIKREVLLIFGYLDEKYEDIDNAIIDFCLRINECGYSTVMVNGAFVHTSTTAVRWSEKLLARYPYCQTLVDQYFKQLDGLEHFTDVLIPCTRPKLLYNIHSLPSLHNGSSEYQLSLLVAFYKLYSDKYDIHILVNQEADSFHQVSTQYSNVAYEHTLTGVFDLCIMPTQVYNLESLQITNKHCLRYVLTLQDVIGLRCQYINRDNAFAVNKLFRQSIKYADGIIAISNYSLDDCLAYFQAALNPKEIIDKSKVIYHIVQGTDKNIDAVKTGLPFDNYILVFGNDYKHKFIQPTIEILKTLPRLNFIVVGVELEQLPTNIACYASGYLSDEFIDSLYANAQFVIFPSLYEGFGLPTFYAAKYGKQVIIKNNKLNKELLESFPAIKSSVILYETPIDLHEKITQLSKATEFTTTIDTMRDWSAVAADTEQFVSDVLARPINVNRLNERYHEICAYMPANVAVLPTANSDQLQVSNEQSQVNSDQDRKIGTKEMLEYIKKYLNGRLRKVL